MDFLLRFSFLLLYNFLKKRSVRYDSDLAGSQGPTKARKPMDFGREDLGDAWQ